MKNPWFKKLLTFGASASLLISTLHAGQAEIGKAAPDFELKNLQGDVIKLSEHADKTVVLEWTNYDCPFVKKHYVNGDMPALQKKYADKGVVWLSVSSGPEGKQGNLAPEAYQARAESEGSAAAHILLDRDGQVGKAYGATNTPHLFIVHQGQLVYSGAIDSIKSVDAADVSKAENYVAKALDEILAGKAVSTPKTKAYGCGVKY